MQISYINAARLEVQGTEEEIRKLRKTLTFKDKPAFYAYQRMKHNRWFAGRYGQEKYQEELDRLKSLVNVCLLEDDGRRYTTLSGFAQLLIQEGAKMVGKPMEYPLPQSIAYAEKPPEPRYYQEYAINALMGVGHGSIELATGGGKTLIIAELIRRIGHRAVVTAPTKSIAVQMFKQFTKIFGAKRVGMFGDGKKVSTKLITVCIGKSLAMLEEDSEHWKNLSQAKILIVDEAHTTPQAMLAKVCLGMLANAPYRFFVSATQMRNDGKDMLLDGIIGPIVYRKDLKELVEEGFLARPRFFGVKSVSPLQSTRDDFLEMAEMHIYTNPVLHRQAADIINRSVRLLGHQVLVLVDQARQFKLLLPYIEFEVGFAHAELSKKNEDDVPPQYRESDPEGLVDRFNKGELKVLVGTGCIAMGTDILPPKTVIFLMAGQSEIKVRQAVGRGTRMPPGKGEFNWIDFDIKIPNCPDEKNMLHRHFEDRCTYYEYEVKMI